MIKNNAFKVLKNISTILNGEEITSRNDTPKDLTLNDMVHFKYTPITSVDVEQSLSTYKNILSDLRRRKNLKNHLIVQCNNVCIGVKKTSIFQSINLIYNLIDFSE